MILRDRLQVIEGKRIENDYGTIEIDWRNPVVVETLAAQVDYRATSVDLAGGFRITEQLVALVARFDTFVASRHRILWRGLHYTPDGSHRTVVAGGRVHHLEIPLKRVTG